MSIKLKNLLSEKGALSSNIASLEKITEGCLKNENPGIRLISKAPSGADLAWLDVKDLDVLNRIGFALSNELDSMRADEAEMEAKILAIEELLS